MKISGFIEINRPDLIEPGQWCINQSPDRGYCTLEIYINGATITKILTEKLSEVTRESVAKQFNLPLDLKAV